MKIIIVGPAHSGKTTLLHRIVRTNPNITFSLILDGYETLPDAHNILANNHPDVNFVITTQNIDDIPIHLRNDSLILNVLVIRGLAGE